MAVASANGLRGVGRAVELMGRGSDTLDAAVEGVKIQELDPADNSVGYGGLPNEEGVVKLNACVMHGPTRRAGSQTPSISFQIEALTRGQRSRRPALHG